MNRKITLYAFFVALALTLFVGCGEHAGEKEYDKAVEAWREGDLARARASFEKAIRKTSGNEKKSLALNQLGLVLWELGEHDAAADAFAKSGTLSEGLDGSSFNLGVALFHAGRFDEAEVALNNVLGDNPRDTAALATLGMIELNKKDWAAATTELGKAATANPRDPAAQNALALAELHRGNNADGAIRRLSAVVSAHPGYAPAAFNLGVINEHWKKDRAAALSWYKQYLSKAGTDASRAPAANRAIARLGGNAAATRTAAARQTDPQAAARYLASASQLYSQKKYAEAVVQFQKSIDAYPNQKNAHYNMGLAYYYDGKYPEAARACENALRIDPNSADAQYMLSLSHSKSRKWSDAERAAKALAKLDPARGEQMLKYISEARKR